jgi:hypothetical protein
LRSPGIAGDGLANINHPVVATIVTTNRDANTRWPYVMNMWCAIGIAISSRAVISIGINRGRNAVSASHTSGAIHRHECSNWVRIFPVIGAACIARIATMTTRKAANG